MTPFFRGALVASISFSLGAGLVFAGISAVPCPDGPLLPPTPASYWIWPDEDHAIQWADEHPQLTLCITQVPDGFATQEC